MRSVADSRATDSLPNHGWRLWRVVLAVVVVGAIVWNHPSASAQGSNPEPRRVLVLEIEFAAQEATVPDVSEVVVQLNVTNVSGTGVMFAYFGRWSIEGPEGSEFGGSFERRIYGPNATEAILVGSLPFAVGFLSVEAVALSDEGWGWDQAFLPVYQSTWQSIGTFMLDVEPEGPVARAGASVFITSHSWSLFDGDLGNVSLVYAASAGILVPNIGFSDDDGHDRILLLTPVCGVRSVVVLAVGISREAGVGFGFASVALQDENCQRRSDSRATAILVSDQSSTTVRVRANITATNVTALAATEPRNVSLQFLPRQGELSAVSYSGAASWTVEYRTSRPFTRLEGVVVGQIGNLTFEDYLSVENRAPQLSLASPSESRLSVAPGQEILLYVEAEDPEGSRLDFYWYVNGVNRAANTRSFVFVESTAGTYEVVASMTDGAATLPHTWTITVTFPPPWPNTQSDWGLVAAIVITIVLAASVVALALSNRHLRSQLHQLQSDHPEGGPHTQ